MAHLGSRWESPGNPDVRGKQLDALRDFVRKQPQIKYIFYDQMSLPQGEDKTPEQKAAFSQQLPNINLLYLGCSVLILIDLSYQSRFWTQYEAWLSFMMATKSGLVSTTKDKLRCHFACLHGVSNSAVQVLMDMWANCTAADAHAKLSGDDVTVTNLGDKEMQLKKILSMNELVKEIMAQLQVTETVLTPRAPELTVSRTHPSTVPLSDIELRMVDAIEQRVVSTMEQRILGEVGERVVVSLQSRGQALTSVTPRGHGGVSRAAAPVAVTDLTSRLKELAALHRDGALNADEFEKAKGLVLRQAEVKAPRGCCEWLLGRRRSLASSFSSPSPSRMLEEPAASEAMATTISATRREPAQSQSGGGSARSISMTARL